MALNLAAANTLFAFTGIVSTGYQFSCGAWVKLNAVSNVSRGVMGLFNASDPGNHCMWVNMSSSEVLGVSTIAGTTASTGAVATALTAGQWAYVVCRWIATDLRRISVLFQNGAVEGGASTTTRAPSGLNVFFVSGALGGAGASWDGHVAEAWFADRDIMPTNIATPVATMRQLALRGPFSIPDLAPRVLSYLSFRRPFYGSNVTPGGDDIYIQKLDGGLTYSGAWFEDAGNNIAATPHPPLAQHTIQPRDRYSRMIV